MESKRIVEKRYLVPFVLITSLFFMWGFARSILDVLNKHFQDSMEISVTQSTLIQGATYLAYALMALPAGIIITRWGYRRGVVTGLLLFGLGALAFIPGDATRSFAIFLAALFIIGCGLALLETAANPYATELGDGSTAASRLNLAQSFNGLGCILGPVVVGTFLFADPQSSVALPYSVMAIVVLGVALVFTRVRLPEIKTVAAAGDAAHDAPCGTWATVKRLLSTRVFLAGVAALFCYEIAEIGINSLFINYAVADGWMDKSTATLVLSFGALGLFMVARVAGSAIMSRVPAVKVLAVCGVMTVAGALLVVADCGVASRCGVFMCYAFEAIMFPTVFAITISTAGPSTKIASSLLMMTPLGGAVGTMLMGAVSDTAGFSTAFLVPAAGYAAVAAYALWVKRHVKR